MLWGGVHGLLLCLEKAATSPLRRLTSTRLGRLLSVFVTFHVVVLLWIPFRASSLTSASELLLRLVCEFDWRTVLPVIQARQTWLPILAAASVVSFSSPAWQARRSLEFARMPVWGKAATMLVVVQTALEFGRTEVQPFIYFQF